MKNKIIFASIASSPFQGFLAFDIRRSRSSQQSVIRVKPTKTLFRWPETSAMMNQFIFQASKSSLTVSVAEIIVIFIS